MEVMEQSPSLIVGDIFLFLNFFAYIIAPVY